MNVLDVPKHRRIFMGGFLSWRTLISTLHPPTRTESEIPRSQSLHRPSIQHVSLSHELSPPLPSGSNVVILLMEEILHQLDRWCIPLFTRFYASQVISRISSINSTGIFTCRKILFPSGGSVSGKPV